MTPICNYNKLYLKTVVPGKGRALISSLSRTSFVNSASLN